MAQAYSDPKRANDPHALPDIETFQVTAQTPPNECPECTNPGAVQPDCDDHATHGGWYWWSCFPGCLPDSEPTGPFATEAEALADAQEGSEDNGERLSCEGCGESFNVQESGSETHCARCAPDETEDA